MKNNKRKGKVDNLSSIRGPQVMLCHPTLMMQGHSI